MVNGAAAPSRLTTADLEALAQDWIETWNSRDVERALAGFAPQATFRSPLAQVITGSDLVEGADAMRRYWQAALARIEHLHFTPVDAVCDEAGQSLAIRYLARIDDTTKRACEIFRFEAGLKVSGEAFYGAPD